MPSAFSDQKGAVTAEFMLLLPTLLLGLSAGLGLFNLELARLELSQFAFTQARLLAIGLDPIQRDGTTWQSKLDGQLLCVEASKIIVVKLEEQGCYLKLGS